MLPADRERDAQVTMLEVDGHWDLVYSRRGALGVSWYEAEPRLSLEIVTELRVPLDTAIIDVGGGASALASELVARGYSDVTVLDLSAVAIREARERSRVAVKWLREDVLTWRPDRRYGVWHDRAVLHFFTAESERQSYRHALDSGVMAGGYVVFGVFAPDAPDHCSGLQVRRYSEEDLHSFLGADYFPVITRRDDHVTPGGSVQPFTWTAFQRRESGA